VAKIHVRSVPCDLLAPARWIPKAGRWVHVTRYGLEEKRCQEKEDARDRGMKRELFDIWKDDVQYGTVYPWRAQLVNYIGRFPTQDAAEKFVAATKAAREKAAKSPFSQG
jgi:hypothetical protein